MLLPTNWMKGLFRQFSGFFSHSLRLTVSVMLVPASTVSPFSLVSSYYEQFLNNNSYPTQKISQTRLLESHPPLPQGD